jgi:hypothetical protein
MSYQLWNKAIGHRWFQETNQGRSIILVADSSFLNSLARDYNIPLGNLTAQQHFIDSVRQAGPWARNKLKAEELPSTSAYLALSILAVSQMDSATRQGMTSYWMPFNSLYGLDGTNRHIPPELKSIWLNLWLDLKEWANVRNCGKYGFVRFPDHASYGVRDPHKNIRFPKSQSLLKLEDLKQLTAWFDRIGLHPGETLSRRWLADRIREDISASCEFSVHAQRVFRDDLRFDPAVDQVMCFFTDWDGVVWSLGTQNSTSRSRSRLVFTFRSNAELVVGIQKRRDSKWTTEAKCNSFPARQAHSSNAPRLESPVAAVWCAQTRLFLQSKLIAANDRYLLFVKPSAYLNGVHGKATYLSQFLDDLQKVSSRVEPYLPPNSTMSRTYTWDIVPQLEQDWCLFAGTASERLDETQLTSRTKGIFAPDLSKLRVVGGVKIDRQRWFSGAGPELRIDGPLKSGTIHCTTLIGTMRSDSTIQFEDGYANASNDWPLNNIGIHRLWIVGAEGTSIEVSVSNAILADAEKDLPGWNLRLGKWAEVSNVSDCDTFVSGALVVGELPDARHHVINRSREFIDAIVSMESTSHIPISNLSKNPLVAQLQRVSLARKRTI